MYKCITILFKHHIGTLIPAAAAAVADSRMSILKQLTVSTVRTVWRPAINVAERCGGKTAMRCGGNYQLTSLGRG